MWKSTDFDKTCGDCIHADICEHNPSLEFSRENIAWCDSFKDKTDVVEVRHGEWKLSKTEFGWNCKEYPSEYTCSLCGRTEKKMEPYCHCGAKMDGKRKDGEQA